MGIIKADAQNTISWEVADKKRGDFKMDKYVCDLCGYVYDPATGDADGGIEPGTAFADLPEDWVCPMCGADKSQFSKEE